MKGLKLLFSKNYWKYIFSIKRTANAVLGSFGIIWLLVEGTSFFSQPLSDFFKAHWQWLLIILILWVIYENWPKTEFCYKLKDRDIHIQLSIGDLFKYNGDLIIPVNTSLDTSFENNLISRNSTQGQFTIKYFNEPRYLDQDINLALEPNMPVTNLPDKKQGNKLRYAIGLVIKLPLPLRQSRTAYLSATADMNNEGIASTNFDNILLSLGKLWEFIQERGELADLNVPVLGTGRGRVRESRETIIKAIIHSFISATSSSKKFCNKLNIVIHPKDFFDHEINIKELVDFIKLKTKYYQHETTITNTGEAIG